MAVNRHDVIGGVILMALGASYAAHAVMNLDIGTTLLMGPGYFPVVLGSILFILGLAIAVRSSGVPTPVLAAVPWRAALLVTAAPILFGVTARGLGLAPATALASMTAAYSSTQMTVRTAVLLALGLSGFCVLVFYYGLNLPLPLIGPWLGF